MLDDPIVEDVYRARGRILERCHGDLGQWIEQLKVAEAQHADRVVDLETVRNKRQRAESPTPPSR